MRFLLSDHLAVIQHTKNQALIKSLVLLHPLLAFISSCRYA